MHSATPKTDQALRYGGPGEVLGRLERLIPVARELELANGNLHDQVERLLAVILALRDACTAGAPAEIRAAAQLARETIEAFGESGAVRASMAARFKTPFG